MGNYAKFTFQKVNTEEPIFTWNEPIPSPFVPKKGETIKVNGNWYKVRSITKHYNHTRRVAIEAEQLMIDTVTITICVWVETI